MASADVQWLFYSGEQIVAQGLLLSEYFEELLDSFLGTAFSMRLVAGS